jgi:hypothetical protein
VASFFASSNVATPESASSFWNPQFVPSCISLEILQNTQTVNATSKTGNMDSKRNIRRLFNSRYKKLSHYMPRRHLGVETYSSYSFLTLALDGGEWSASHSGCALALGEGSPVTVWARTRTLFCSLLYDAFSVDYTAPMIWWQVNDDDDGEYTRASIHALSGIWTHGLNIQVIKAYASDMRPLGLAPNLYKSYSMHKKYCEPSMLHNYHMEKLKIYLPLHIVTVFQFLARKDHTFCVSF